MVGGGENERQASISLAQMGIGAATGNPVAVGVGAFTLFAAGLSEIKEHFSDDKTDFNGQTQQLRKSAEPRKIVYGKQRTSGSLVFADTNDTAKNLSSSDEAEHYVGKTSGDDLLTNEYLNLIFPIAGHEIESFEKIFIEGKEISRDGDNNVDSGKFKDKVRINEHLGADDQSADTDLVNVSDKWTEDHRLRGIAYLYVQIKWDRDVFTSIPNVSAVIKGKNDIRDPRDDSTKYTTNSALCSADYLESNLGLDVNEEEIDDDTLKTAANVCEEQVTDNEGGQQDRFDCNVVLSSDSTHKENMTKLLSSMVGYVFYSEGKFHVKAANYTSPVLEIDESNIRTNVSISTGNSRSDQFNKVKGVFTSPNNNWQKTSFKPVTNGDYVRQDNDVEQVRNIELNATTNGARAAQIASIYLRKSRRDITVSLSTGLKAMELEPGDTVELTLDRMGWDKKEFEVTQWVFEQQEGDNGNPVLGIKLQLRETDVLVYDETIGYGEEGYGEFGYGGLATKEDIAPSTNLPDSTQVTAINNLNATSSGRAFVQQDGAIISSVVLDWESNNDAFTESGGYYEIQLKRSANNTWRPQGFTDANDTDIEFEGLEIDKDYDFRVRAHSGANSTSDWVSITNHTISGDTTSPDAPTGLSASQGTGKTVQLTWDANSESDLNEYTIYRNTKDSFDSNDDIAQVDSNSYIDTDVSFNTDYDYWVEAVDGSENSSSESNKAEINLDPVPNAQVDQSDPSNPNSPNNATGSIYQDNDNNDQPDSDGTIRAKINYDPPSVPSDAEYVNILLRRDGELEWETVASNITNTNKRTINDLAPDTAYDLGAVAVTFSGQVSGASTVNNVSTPAKGDAPGAPDNLTLSDKTGRAIELNWDRRTEKDLDHYSVYRNTSNDFSTATLKNEEVRDIRWTDTNFQTGDYGTKFYYWVTATDTSNNEGTESSVASEILNSIPEEDADATEPTTPDAPTDANNKGNYISTDGSTRGFIDLNIPAKKSDARHQNLLYRESNGSSEWRVADQLQNTSSVTARVDDLTSGINYDFALNSISAYGVPGSSPTESTDNPITAPAVTSNPSNVTGFDTKIINKELGLINLSWDAVSDNDLKEYEIRRTRIGDASSFSEASFSSSVGSDSTGITTSISSGNWKFFIKSVDTSGNKSASADTTTLFLDELESIGLFERAKASIGNSGSIGRSDRYNDFYFTPYRNSDNGTNDISIFDISDLTNPKLQDTISSSDITDIPIFPNGDSSVSQKNNNLFVVGEGEDENGNPFSKVTIIDISNINSLPNSSVNSFEDDGQLHTIPISSLIKGNTLFVLTVGSLGPSAGEGDLWSGLISIDISDINNLSTLDRRELAFADSENCRVMVKRRNHIFVGTDNDDRVISSVDISDPSSLGLSDTLSFNDSVKCTELFLIDEYLFYADKSNTDSNGILKIINISDPSNMNVISTLEDSSLENIKEIVVKGTNLYALIDNTTPEWAIIDIEDISNPTIKSTPSTDNIGSANFNSELRIINNKAIMVDSGNMNLQVIG